MNSSSDCLNGDEESMGSRFLTFPLGNEMYGIAIEYVNEIIHAPPITQIPEMPDYVSGLINLRGIIIPVIDARLRLRKPPKDIGERACIIVVGLSNLSIGLIVGSVSDVLTIPNDRIATKPEIKRKGNQDLVKWIGNFDNQIILLIDCQKLVLEDDFEIIARHNQEDMI